MGRESKESFALGLGPLRRDEGGRCGHVSIPSSQGSRRSSRAREPLISLNVKTPVISVYPSLPVTVSRSVEYINGLLRHLPFPQEAFLEVMEIMKRIIHEMARKHQNRD